MVLDASKEFSMRHILGTPGPEWSGDGSLSGEDPSDIRFLSANNYKPDLANSSGLYPLAPFRRRLVAFLIDELLVMSLLFIIWIILAVAMEPLKWRILKRRSCLLERC